MFDLNYRESHRTLLEALPRVGCVQNTKRGFTGDQRVRAGRGTGAGLFLWDLATFLQQVF